MKQFLSLSGIVRLAGALLLVGLTLGSTATGAFAAQERGGAAYSSAELEFSVTWDDSVWQGNELAEGEGVELSSELSYARIQGYDSLSSGAEGCLQSSAAGLLNNDDVDGFDQAPSKLERPNGARDAASELYTYIDANSDDEVVLYIECRDLPVDDAVLQIILLSHEPDYADEVATWDELLGDIDSGQASSSKKDNDDSGKLGKESKKAGLDGNTYTDSELEFSVTWDEEDWAVRKTKEEDGLGIGIEVQTDSTIGWVTGDPLKGPLQSCASDFAEGVGTFEFVTKMKLAPKSYDVPATSDDAVGGLYTYTDVTNDPVKMVAYFECRLTGDGEHVVTVLLATTKATYEDQLPLWEGLLGGIVTGESQADKANDDDEDNSEQNDSDNGEEQEQEAVVGATVSGARFGFELTYDDSVWTVKDLSDENNDFYDLSSDLAIGTVIGFDMPYEGQTCIDTLAELKQGDGVTGFDVAPKSMERPRSSKVAEGELFVYTIEGNDGPVDAVTYIECRPLQDGAATLGVMFTTVPSVYENALPVFEQLLAGISTGVEA